MPDYKPGCYGSAVCCYPTSSPCNACGFAKGCSEMAEKSAEMLRAKYGITVEMQRQRQAARRPISALPAHKPGGLSVKATQLLAAISRQGVDLRKAIENKVNPFQMGSSPAYMKEVTDALMRGGFTREGLRNSLVNNRNWSAATADSHIAFIVPALEHMNLIRFDDGTFKYVGAGN